MLPANTFPVSSARQRLVVSGNQTPKRPNGAARSVPQLSRLSPKRGGYNAARYLTALNRAQGHFCCALNRANDESDLGLLCSTAGP